MSAMGMEQTIEAMSDEEIMTAFETSVDPETRGFDEVTLTRVLASELVRARNRVAHYRTLLNSFLAEGKRFMIENVAEDLVEDGVPVKLVFTDDYEHVQALAESDEVVIWTEVDLLDALKQERVIQDFFCDTLEEMVPIVTI
jgi:hypothetical protein